MRVHWTRKASEQFKHQHRYLAERSLEAADRLARDVQGATEVLARNPLFGRQIAPQIREWGIGRSKRYVIRYAVKRMVIDIIEFWHSAQARPVPHAYKS